MSRVAIVVYGILSGIFAIILQEIGLNLGWVYLFMGIVIGSAVVPVALSVTWSKASGTAAIIAAITGQLFAVATWLIVCATENDGEINVDNLGQDNPMLAGNLVAICLSGIVMVVLSYIFPQDFDWVATKEIPMIEQDGSADLAKEGVDSEEGLKDALRFTMIWGTVLSLILILVWPLLALPATVFSENYFTFWVIIALIWGWVATLIMIFLPVYEAKDGLLATVNHLIHGQATATSERASKRDLATGTS